MGSDESTANQSQEQMVQLDVSVADRDRVDRSKNKPSPLYAKLADHTPTLLPTVIDVKQKQTKHMKFSEKAESTEVLPLYQMVAVPSIFYKGGWENGKQHGKGQVMTKSGIYFLGEFVYGAAECSDGLVVFPDGSHYRGAFLDNQFHGAGRFVSAFNETAYEGRWERNRPHGEGKESYQDKSYYHGHWANGRKHGKGFFNWSDGKVYNGFFEDGEMHGEGELFYPQTKSMFRGRFERGLKVEGELGTAYGKYEGRFQNGLMHDARAKFTWHDGRVYEGPFEFGQMHGRGRLVNGGVTVQGVWERGENVLIEQLG